MVTINDGLDLSIFMFYLSQRERYWFTEIFLKFTILVYFYTIGLEKMSLIDNRIFVTVP